MKKRILAGLGFALGLMLLAVPAWAGDAEVGMVDGDSGEWHVREPNGSDRNFFYGNPGDIPLIGDWDCDGVETPGMFRPGSGFVYLTNGNPADNGVALGEIFYYFGIPGDIPIAGDWDGDGCDSPGIYRNGQVFLRDKLSTGFANRAFYFGVPGDRPFAGDWDGDGIDTVGIYRNGTGQIFYTNENPVSGVATTANDFFYGIPSDEFIPGDWDGDGIETVGIYRSSESRFYLRNENSTGTADESFVFGQEGWLPIGGDTELRDASLTASTGLLDFGAVGLDGTGTATLTVNFNGDGGDADLRITSIEFDQPGANFSAAPLTDPDIGFGESRAIEVSMAPTFLGVKRGSIRISHSGTNSPLIVDLIGRASHRVNAGGDPIDDWRADSPFSPGGNIGPLAGTSVSGPTAPDEVFESYRFGQQAWDFSVWPGSYRVNLYFAETFLDSAGARLFDVSIEGVEVLTGFDIYDAAGGKNRGIVRGFDIVSDANLDIDFTEIVNSPAIQGIEIVPMPVLKGLGSTPSEVVFGSTAVGDTLTRTITIVHLGEPTTGSVNVPGVSIVGDDAAQFAIVSGAGARTVTSGNPFDVVVEFRPTTAGVFDAQLFISHSGTNSPLRVDLSGAADNVIVYRLNTGGDAIVGQTSWSPDEAYIVPGTPSGEFAIVSAIDTSDQSLPPGTPIAMIRTERFGSSQVPLSYDLPVPNGPYEVRLYFVESVHTAAGVRVFDVRLEGNLAINDLDIFARAGKDKAIMIPRQANVTDGVLDIDLSPIAGKNLPAIHGIEIIKKEGNAFLSVDPVSLTLGPIVTSGTTTANVEVSHDGGAGIPSILIQSVSITGPDSGRFTLLSGPSANDVLPPGTSDMAQIRFTPGVIGDKAANLTIQYNGGRLITVPLVGSVNNAPVMANPGTRTGTEGVTFSVTGTATDPDTAGDGDFRTVTAAGLPSWASVTASGDGTITIGGTPGFADAGSSAVTLTVTDPDGLTDSETFTISIANFNRPPTFNESLVDQTNSEGEVVSISTEATDLDGDDLTWSATGLPGGTTISPASGLIGGTIGFNAGNADPGVYNVTVTVTDNGAPNKSATDSFTWTVNDFNQAPVLAAITNKTTNEGSLVSFLASATDGDPGQTLTFSLEGSVPGGTSITPLGGAFTWIPSEGQGPGVYTFDVVVTDNGTPNLEDRQTIQVTVNEVNSAPVLAAVGNKVLPESTLLSFTAAATDSDVPAQTLTFSLGGPPGGASINPTSGVFSWTPSEGQGPGVYTFDVVVTDNGSPNLEDRETIQVTVNEANNAPVLAAVGNKVLPESTLLSFTAAATDSDVPAQTLTFSLGGPPGGASINPTSGVFSWTPSEGQGPGVYTFDVVVTDNGSPNLEDRETIQVTVNETNAPPVLAAIGNKSLAETTLLSFTAAATDSDVPAQTLTFSLGGPPGGASINPTSGVFSWTPSEGQGPGVYTFDVVVTDNGSPNREDRETIQVTVNEVNSSPVLGAIGDRVVDELSTLGFTAAATDSDVPAQTLTFSLGGPPGGASINPTSGVFSWTPSEGQGPGVYTFDVVVTDNGSPNREDRETIQVTVNEVPDPNTAPTLAAINPPASIDELVLWSFTATATDPESPPQTLTFSLAGAVPTGASINPTSGVFSWTPTEAQDGAHTFDVVVTDNGTGSLSDSETINITVNEVPDPNTAPTLAAINPPASIDELVLWSFTATATDPESPPQTLTFSLAGAVPTGASINPTSGVFSWTPTEAQDGAHTFDVVVTDNGTGSLSDSETINITVNEVPDPNTAPTLAAINPPASIDELVLWSFTATATDPESPPQTLTFSLAGAVPTGASINPTSGVFSWTPTEAQDGAHTFDVVVTDNGTGSLSDSETINITVNEVPDPNTAPTLAAINPPASIDELVLWSFTATATDPESPPQTLTFSLAGAVPTGASINPTSGVFSWTPTEGQGPGVYTFDVVVTDNGTGSLSDSETINITVNEVPDPNTAPTLAAINPPASIDELVLWSFTATATDPESPPQTLTFSLAGAVPTGASINPTSGVFSWTPTEAQDGAHTFDVVVTDNGTGSLSDSETINITVNEVPDPNTAPTLAAINPPASIDELVLWSFTATATDPESPPQTLTFSLAGAVPTGASINPTSGVFSWTPTEAQDGAHTFDVVVTDNGTGSLSDSETINITVNEVPDPNTAPTLAAINPPASIDELVLWSFTATATDPESPPQTLTFSLAGAVPTGASINPTSGVFSWTPTEGQGPGVYTFDVVVTDNGTGSLSDSETINITVNEVPDPNTAPTLAAINPPASIDELVLWSFTATATDPESPPQTLTFSLAGAVPTGASINPTSGVFSWTPTEAQDGAHTFDVVVTDNGTGSLSDSETINITVNEVP